MYWLIKLRFKGKIRIGSGDASFSERLSGLVHSDTIFSGLVNEWVRVHDEEPEDIVKALNGDNPPFLVTSAFPFFKTGYYLPCPLGLDEFYLDELPDVSWLELNDFIDLANGKLDRLRGRNFFDPSQKVFLSRDRQRVSIDRITSATNTYFVNSCGLHPAGGLYVILKVNQQSILKKLKLCFNLLGESGLGGGRAIGFGQFEPEFIDVSDNSLWQSLFKERNDAKAYCSLSLCSPRDASEASSALSYGILNRKGWIYSTSSNIQLKRKTCRMFSEGSLFDKSIYGRIVSVTPNVFLETEHEVYRYGLAMLVPLR